MVHLIKAPTATLLHDKLANSLLFGSRTELDDANSVDVQLHNVVAEADSFEWLNSAERFWTTRSRWNTMVRQYIDPVALQEWLNIIEGRFPSSKRGVAVLRTNTVASRNTGRGVTRRWGSCMLSLSYRVKPWPQITLHSRTCYLGYLSVLDMTVAHVCARLAGARSGVDPTSMRFVWNLEMAQFHGFRCLAYPVGGSDDFFEEFTAHDARRETYPGVYLARKEYDKIEALDNALVPYGDQSFSSSRRVRRRFHTQVHGYDYALQFEGGKDPKNSRAYRPIPHTSTDDLDFTPIGIIA
jgi:hypothetical protein